MGGCCKSSKSQNLPPVPHPAAVPNSGSPAFGGVVAQPSSSYPNTRRCKIQDCVYTNLSAADTFSHSELKNCQLGSPADKKGRLYIKRSKVKNSQVHNSELKRCGIKDCVVTNIGRAKRVDAHNSQLDQVKYVRRCGIEHSSVRQSNSLKWTDLKHSEVLQGSVFKKAKLVRSKAVNSSIRRSTVEDCEVHDAVLDRCHFKGLVLENGVWKHNNLIGRTSDREVVVRPINEAGTTSPNYSQGHVIIRTRDVPIMTALDDSDSDHDSVSSPSEAADDNDDHEVPAKRDVPGNTPLGKEEDSMPPPYQP